MMSKLFIPLFFAALTACSNNAHFDPSKAHHTPSGFKNINYEDNKGAVEFLKWRWGKLFKDIPEADDYHFSADVSQHERVRQNQHEYSLTWIGHATFLIQLQGMNILTDPHFSQRASPFDWLGPKRVIEPAMQLHELPEIDVVVISHDHYDSLDVESIRGLAKHKSPTDVTFIVPLGLKAWFDTLNIEGLQVIELDWGQSHSIDNVNFIAEPSQHWSKRTLFDAFERLWASWVIESVDRRIFFAGDTGYADHFRLIGKKYGYFDLALLPIGAYEPRWFMKPYHVNPQEAVRIHQDIHSKYSVAMHWGTFILTDEPLDEAPIKLREALFEASLPLDVFEAYRHGQTRFFDD